MTQTVQNEIPKNYVPTESEVKSSPVFWIIVYPNLMQEEKQQKKN